MTVIKRTISISPELDEAIAMLSAANNTSYSGYVESRLLMNETVKQMILKLEKLPEMPVVDVDKLKKEEDPEPLVA